MKPNLLDDLFKNQLKDQKELPQGVAFRKEEVLASINTKLSHRSKRYNWIKYAVVVLLFILSGYWHWWQQQEIIQQKHLLATQEGYIKQNRKELAAKLEDRQAYIDSLEDNVNPILDNEKLVSLPSLPAAVMQHKLIVAPTMAMHITEPIYISDKEIPNHKSSVPELDLPVYYESERLANNNEASNGRKFRRKLTELLNN